MKIGSWYLGPESDDKYNVAHFGSAGIVSCSYSCALPRSPCGRVKGEAWWFRGRWHKFATRYEACSKKKLGPRGLFFISLDICEDVASKWRIADKPQNEPVDRKEPDGQTSFKVNK
jgi:hypothetical protein